MRGHCTRKNGNIILKSVRQDVLDQRGTKRKEEIRGSKIFFWRAVSLSVKTLTPIFLSVSWCHC